MCIAILNRPGSTIERDSLENSWNNNNDGAGMLYVTESGLKTHKEMKHFDAFYKKYLHVKEHYPASWVVLHFRIGTHGAKCLDNCHPFMVNKRLGFVHNGMLCGKQFTDSFHSDTALFNKLYLQTLPKDFLNHPTILNLLENFASPSKMIFLDDQNVPTILNEAGGDWDGDNWYSNKTYKYSYTGRDWDFNGWIWDDKKQGYTHGGASKPTKKQKRAAKKAAQSDSVTAATAGTTVGTNLPMKFDVAQDIEKVFKQVDIKRYGIKGDEYEEEEAPYGRCCGCGIELQNYEEHKKFCAYCQRTYTAKEQAQLAGMPWRQLDDEDLVGDYPDDNRCSI
jgi:hypothetical protein